MSGPKSSSYTLTAAQRRMLQEQLRRAREAAILLERKQNELEKINHLVNNVNARVEAIRQVIDKTERFSKEGEKSSIDASAVNKLCDKVSKECEKAHKLSVNQSLEQLCETKDSVTSVLKEINQVLNDAEISLKRQEESFRNNVMGQIMLGVDISFSNIADRNAFSRNKFKNLIQEEMSKITGLELSSQLEEKYKVLVEKAEQITSVDYLENFYSLSVIPFVKECLAYEKLEREIGDDYRALKIRYESLAKDMGVVPIEIAMDDKAVYTLLNAITELEAEELKRKEEEYISQCIDDAMKAMNYSVVGAREVTKKSGKHFRNVLYKFDEGTAVNVTYSNNGQITMELCGVDEQDREPTEAERRSLEDDMRSFCDDYYVIEKKLKEKGIEPKLISHLPPEAQYAQILNVSDYEMSEKIGKYEGTKSRKTSGQQAGMSISGEG
ncbi:MAG: hypothetical protein K5900_07630 [Butyrivibrio sp.]|nr:hypothetical protein [Butyrivibrio sp.]